MSPSLSSPIAVFGVAPSPSWEKGEDSKFVWNIL